MARRDVGPSAQWQPGGGIISNDRLRLAHFRKIRGFDLATYYLCKVEGLLLRLIFENLGAATPSVDVEKPEWEKHVTWEEIKHKTW